MSHENEEIIQEENKSEKAFRCQGSYTRGTACANEDLPKGVRCVRCDAREYGPEQKAEAIAAELQRTKDLPADRVKKDGYAVRKSEEQKAEDRAEMKEEIKAEMKPELKNEIKEELKEEEKKPIDPSPEVPNDKKQ
jgi:hypothetical protein